MSEDRSTKPKVAIFSAHGMGQQIQFGTINRVFQGLERVLEKKQARVVAYDIGGKLHHRVEFDVKLNGKTVETHLYEAYWAPITEGKVHLRDVMAFLLNAGWNGFKQVRGFERHIFGYPEKFMVAVKSFVEIAIALYTVFILTGVNLLLLAGLFELSSRGVFSHNPYLIFRDQLLYYQSWNLGFLTIILLTVAAFLALILKARRLYYANKIKLWLWKLLNYVLATLIYGWFLLFLGLMTIVLGISLDSFLAGWFRGYVDDFAMQRGKPPVWLVALVWISLPIFAYYIRILLIQYIGDVAAYISSHKLDRFQEIRREIKATVMRELRCVFEAEDANGCLLYDHVALFGHSLGTVILYDALNAMINEDEYNNHELRVLERTRTFISFGSPLDKTAFMFRVQSHNVHSIREKMAAAVQPLIQNYEKYRKLDWVNVYARGDIIGAALNYYDLKKETAEQKNIKGYKPIDNIPDTDALIPLVSHSEHWETDLVFKELKEKLFDKV